MSLPKDTNPSIVLSQALLNSISEVLALAESVDIEQENFMEAGSYLDRTSPVIKELQIAENASANSEEVLQFVSKQVDIAKDLTSKCSNGANMISDRELEIIIEQLERVVKNIGRGLSLIPSSAFVNHEYAEIAIGSLSREMQGASLQVGAPVVGISQPGDLKEQDLYSVNLDSCIDHDSTLAEASADNSQLIELSEQSHEMPRLFDFRRGMTDRGSDNHGSSGSQLFKTVPQVAEYMEPLHERFFCPLGKKIMADPVTIGSGVTYERRTIAEWFKVLEGNSDKIVCPSTGQELESTALNSNFALKTTIQQWIERNEATRIRMARAALSLASSETTIIKAMKDLQCLCQKRIYNTLQVRDVGMIPLLAKFLEHEERRVKTEALETLLVLAKDDEESKEMMGKTKIIKTMIKMLSSDDPLQRQLALLLLLELSKSESVGQKIGKIPGAILILITMKYKSVDAFTAEKAEDMLKNLEKCHKNIKQMAENGFMEPLLSHLVEGSEEVQMEMAGYLGELVLSHNDKTYVAERASTALLKMVHNGNTLTRKAAFKALVQLSSHHPNSKTLVEAGIVPIMTEEMFARRIYNEPVDSKEESAVILANIMESGIDPATLQVNTHNHTMASDYIIYNIAQMIKSSETSRININLIKILLCLMQQPKSMATVVSVIKETESSHTLVELLNSPQEELSIASAKLLISLSAQIGHTIVDRLCKTKDQPESLVNKPEANRITEKHAVWATLLAKLPHQNLTLNLALLHKGTVSTTLQRVQQIQRGSTRASRFASSYLEGLVGILVRFTTTLYDPSILFLARDENLASVFTGLLISTGNDEVQRLSAIGLENLSSESIHLSRPPEVRKRKLLRFLPRCFSIGGSHSDWELHLCPVHRGSCSAETTFCLVETRAIEKLLACLDHENVGVVQAALSAICTLLDDKVDVDKSVNLLSEVNMVQHVLNVLREHREEGLWQKSFWVIERFLMKGGDRSTSDISEDRLLPSTLVSAFHHGDNSTREMAEKILRHLNKLPNFSKRVIL